MEKFVESPIFLKAAIIVEPVAFLLQVIGLASPYWISVQSVNSGLWKVCGGGECVNFPVVPDWLGAVRAMEILGLLCILATVVFIVLSIFMSNDMSKTVLPTVAIASSFIAAALIVIGVVIYAVKDSEGGVSITDYISWALGLCIAAAILSFINGILVILSKVFG